ncbi:MAG: PCP degradation transcriptional activation protein [Burkholderia plantarii]|nr:MAG: PCP degradation transcriptional activation protein [Burkholderia plantarii]
MERGLEAGAVDLAVGYFPDLDGSNFFQQRLFTHRFICLMRREHPLAGAPLTVEQYLACGHAVVRAEGGSQEVLDSSTISRSRGCNGARCSKRRTS